MSHRRRNEKIKIKCLRVTSFEVGSTTEDGSSFSVGCFSVLGVSIDMKRAGEGKKEGKIGAPRAWFFLAFGRVHHRSSLVVHRESTYEGRARVI